MRIGPIDLLERRLVIAEIGNNHEGDASVAVEMVLAAAEAGADAVKVQVINPEKLVNRSQSERITQLSRFRLSMETFDRMAEAASARNILFIASAFDEDSLQEISGLVSAVKIASGDIDDVPLLMKAASVNKPIILSTGAATLDEVRTAVSIIAENRSSDGPLAHTLALLHCVSLYPAAVEDANLSAIQVLKDTFDLVSGYSDHTLGIEVAILSLAYGARIIEKHFTLDKKRSSFRDHQLSADPGELRRLAEFVHGFPGIIGSNTKVPSALELEALPGIRRSIVAARNLDKGTVLQWDDFAYVRPREGLPPTAAPRLVGKKLRVSLQAHDIVMEHHVERG